MSDLPPVDPDERPGEVGRQNERTTLAWRRTNLSALGVAALAAKAASETLPALLVLAAAFVTTAVIGHQADRRTRRRATAVDEWVAGGSPAVASPAAVASATALTVGLAVIGIAIVVLL